MALAIPNFFVYNIKLGIGYDDQKRRIFKQPYIKTGQRPYKNHHRPAALRQVLSAVQSVLR